MSQLDQIKAKIDHKLYELTFFDAADLGGVTITTSSTGSIKNSHDIVLASGTYNGRNIEGEDSKGHNIHLPVEYIIDIN
jgi:hypothetical protein